MTESLQELARVAGLLVALILLGELGFLLASGELGWLLSIASGTGFLGWLIHYARLGKLSDVMLAIGYVGAMAGVALGAYVFITGADLDGGMAPPEVEFGFALFWSVALPVAWWTRRRVA
jgi:hypothetical protein